MSLIILIQWLLVISHVTFQERTTVCSDKSLVGFMHQCFVLSTNCIGLLKDFDRDSQQHINTVATTYFIMPISMCAGDNENEARWKLKQK